MTLFDWRKKVIECLDYTSLNDSDTHEKIVLFCQQATTSLGAVAAVCVYPQFVKTAKDHLKMTSIKVATVVNFPTGNSIVKDVIAMTARAVHDEVDEIDLVFPYDLYREGQEAAALSLVTALKMTYPEKTLKVILETGAFNDMKQIEKMSFDVLKAGADFIKTSTGKIAIGATLPAVEAMLNSIKRYYKISGKLAGLKVSGGVRTLDDVMAYINLAEHYLGAAYIQPTTFRIGASALLNHLLMPTENNTIAATHY